MADGLVSVGATEHRAALLASTGGARQMDDTARSLAAWLEGRLGRNVAVTDVRMPKGAGIANETLLFEAAYDAEGRHETRGLVARIMPKVIQLFPEPDFAGLYRLLQTLHEGGLVKVPQVLWLEQDAAVLGAPFFVMDMVKGRTPVSQPLYNVSGWLAEATPEQRRSVWTTAMQGMASVHKTPGELISFIGWPQYGPTGEDQQLGYWEHYSEWTGVPMPPSVVSLGEWVRANRPHVPGIYLSWGDARLGNMMFGNDFRLAGVLDWDQMSLADPRHDLAWWLFFDEHFSGGFGVDRLEGLGGRKETIATWEELTGLTAGDLGWHEAYVTYKLGLITMKTLVDGGRPYDASAALTDQFIERGRASAGI